MLQKVLPIIMAMKQRCTSVYRLNAQNSIDEAMIPFKGTYTHVHVLHSLILRSQPIFLYNHGVSLTTGCVLHVISNYIIICYSLLTNL